MTVTELRDMLEDFDEDSEVLLAFQPSWPLQFKVNDVVEVDDVVYVVEGGHPDESDLGPYAPAAVFE